MKYFPVIADTIFYAVCAFLLGFCALRFWGVSAPLHLPPGVRRIRNAGEIANDPIFQDLFQKRNTVITEF